MSSVTRTVLIADDQSTPRDELREILRRAGYTVVADSRSTDDTLEKFERYQPDAVIIDVALPGTLDALVAIQRMHRANLSVAIFVTGTASQNNILMESLSMGALDFFLKPFQQGSVKLCLQRNLG